MTDRLNGDDRIVPQVINMSATNTICGTYQFLLAPVGTITRGVVIRGYT